MARQSGVVRLNWEEDIMARLGGVVRLNLGGGYYG